MSCITGKSRVELPSLYQARRRYQGMAHVMDSRQDDIGKLLLRIALGGILLFHGVFKLTHGVEWIKQPLAALGLPGFLAYGTYLAEVVAPVLLILGYRTR